MSKPRTEDNCLPPLVRASDVDGTPKTVRHGSPELQFPRKGRVRSRLVGSSLFLALGICAVNSYGQCPVGNGFAANVLCYGKYSCYGAPRIFPDSTGRSWSREPSPCDCVYSVGCVIQNNVLQHHREDKNEQYQSRPLFFRGCGGELALALPVRRVNLAKQG